VINGQPPPLQAFLNPIGRAYKITPLDRFQPAAEVGRRIGDEVKWGVRVLIVKWCVARRCRA
jgi:hypothetical protein